MRFSWPNHSATDSFQNLFWFYPWSNPFHSVAVQVLGICKHYWLRQVGCPEHTQHFQHCRSQMRFSWPNYSTTDCFGIFFRDPPYSDPDSPYSDHESAALQLSCTFGKHYASLLHIHNCRGQKLRFSSPNHPIIHPWPMQRHCCCSGVRHLQTLFCQL